ncbi:MAG: YncE family protein [Myxococcales bacterium]
MLTALVLAATLRFPDVQPPVIMDYLATEGDRVWVPAGNTGNVYVLEKGQFRTIGGFATKKGRGDRLMGPSSVTVGDGTVYVGNRGDQRIWAIDSKTLEKKGSVELPSTPDGTFWVATTKEIWVTTPRDNAIEIVDPSMKVAGRIAIDSPEGYAVDAARGIVYTNQEDKDKTVAIDARTRKIVATWESGCGKEGPRGLALDAGRGALMVACAVAGVNVLDTRTGARKGHVDVGEGVDNIDYVKGLLYASAGRSEKAVVAKLDDDGRLEPVKTETVGKGCRVIVATPDGTGYAADSQGGQLWVIKP